MTCQLFCPNKLNQFIMIEYPGFVKNPDKALETMGGIEAIENVVECQKERLELKFRKSDPLSHPAYGDRVPKKCLVLRIRKHKQVSSGAGSSGDNEEETGGKNKFSMTVLGEVQTAFKFDTMAEFQWLPMQRTNQIETIKPQQLQTGITIKRSPESLNPSYASILNEVLPIGNPFDNTLKNFNPEAPLLILPAVFSRFDTPREIHQPHPKFRSKEMREEFERQQSLSVIGRTRKKRTTMSYLINYTDAIPERPPDKLIRERGLLSSQERSLVPELSSCFEKQKVWSKSALCFELGCSTLDIKYILPLVAFHYLNGPFRTMWVKYGYNPHKDPSSKTLQTLDFRVKGSQHQQEYSRRSIHQYQLPMRKNPDKIRSKQQVDLKLIISGISEHPQHDDLAAMDSSSLNELSGNRGIIITEAMCKFRKNLIPVARQLSYQLKDIEVDEVQVMVHANDEREAQECTEKDGWLPDGTIDKIRKVMRRCLDETMNTITNQLEESCSNKELN